MPVIVQNLNELTDEELVVYLKLLVSEASDKLNILCSDYAPPQIDVKGGDVIYEFVSKHAASMALANLPVIYKVVCELEKKVKEGSLCNSDGLVVFIVLAVMFFESIIECAVNRVGVRDVFNDIHDHIYAIDQSTSEMLNRTPAGVKLRSEIGSPDKITFH